MEAQDLGVPATVIEAAVAARALSATEDGAARRGEAFRPAERKLDTGMDIDGVLRDLEQALLAGKIAAYAQGFAVMAKASQEWSWNLPLGTIAKIWRAGCIIRSRLPRRHQQGLRRERHGRQPDDASSPSPAC